jgi:dethiobiotin synthetase
MKVVIAGIGTEVGKTIVSAVFCEAFGLDYWKPIQSERGKLFFCS